MSANRKKLRIGLVGFGTVGRGVWKVLAQTGVRAEIAAICVKDPRRHADVAENFLRARPEQVVTDKSIDVVVEVTNDPSVSHQVTFSALEHGKPIVTASKALVAAHLPDLVKSQKTNGAQVLYEASVCAGIPIIRSLEEYYDTDLLQSISGIVNGSTNYILSRLQRGGESYSEALAQAQQLGYAESDPTLDVSGVDARSKLVILVAHAFGSYVTPSSIPMIGIETLSREDFDFARSQNVKIKLVAQARKEADGSVFAIVAPSFVAAGNRLHDVDDVYNAITTTMAFSETQFFVGRGAGALPTASAVVSDISALSYDYRYEYKKIDGPLRSIPASSAQVRLYVRYQTLRHEQVLSHFHDVEHVHISGGTSYIVGTCETRVLEHLCVISDSIVVY